MKSRIFALCLSAAMICTGMTVWGEEKQNNITAVDGNVTVSCLTDAAKDTPVSIIILPAILDGERDVTAERVASGCTAEELKALHVEYATIVKAGENGAVTHSCKMKDTLSTGICHVVLGFLGSDGWYSAGTFEHVGKNDIAALVEAFNCSDADGYEEIIEEDRNGINDQPAKNILEKSSADIAYYSTLENKAEFHTVLYGFKPATGFDIFSLVSKFNETGAWIRLRTNDDIFTVLNTYNGEGDGKYWNIEIGRDTDYDNLAETEKTALLKAIKEAKYVDREKLETDFKENVILAMFRGVHTREELGGLIAEESQYASYFEKVRKIVSDADLNEYETAELYNNVLDANSSCKTFDEVETLFKASIPQKETSSAGSTMGAKGGYSGSNRNSGKNSTSSAGSNNQTGNVEDSTFCFRDVSSDHWANEFITELYLKGAINGVDSVNFAPQDLVSRQDFVKILVNALDIELTDTKTVFNDVESGAYYEAYVMSAFEKGLVSGIEANCFGVGQNIRREDAAVIMSRVLDSYAVQGTGKQIEFGDGESVADYAKDAVAKVSAAEVFGGDDMGNFNPKANLTRAEACAIICRLADRIKGV